jgi:hypothetical protein
VGRPVDIVYHPVEPIVTFRDDGEFALHTAWLLATPDAIDFSTGAACTGVAERDLADGSLLFVTVGGGVRYFNSIRRWLPTRSRPRL